jgi:hypothetical protein
MKTGKKIIILILILIPIIVVFVFPIIEARRNVTINVERIKESYKGVIVEKYSVRDTPPTHLKIKVAGDKYIKVIPYQKIVEQGHIGDSIIKPKNENFVYLIDSNGVANQIFYTKISYETRKSKHFPKDWKNKWMESSEWDN